MNAKLLVPVLLLSLFAACERPASQADVAEERRRLEQMRALDDRMARLKEMEDRLSEKEDAQTQEERDRLLREKEQLEAERLELTASRKAAEAKATRAEREARAAEDRAKEVALRAEEDRANAQVDFFYPALEPHGEWLEVEGLGYCWQPQVAEDRAWRPYTDGRWVFTEYGWTWKSNEPFGWAVYHYGRWAKLRRVGWVWAPGTEWGPAWVAWRRSDDYVGWAPLPPDAWSATGFTAAVDSYYDIGPGAYSFVPANSLGAQTYIGQVVAPEQNVTIINKTVNITNVTYKKVENTTVVYNAGPDLERVNSGAGEKVPRLKVERVTDMKQSAQAGVATQQGGVLRMVAPQLRSGKKADAAPKNLKERVKADTADRGWSEAGDKAAVEQVRSRAKQEARQAEEQERSGRREARAVATPVPARPATSVATPQPESNATPRPKVERPVRATSPSATPSPATPKVATPPPAAAKAEARPIETDSTGKATPNPTAEQQPPKERAERRNRERGDAGSRVVDEQSSVGKALPAEQPPATPARERGVRRTVRQIQRSETPAATPAPAPETAPAAPSGEEAPSPSAAQGDASAQSLPAPATPSSDSSSVPTAPATTSVEEQAGTGPAATPRERRRLGPGGERQGSGPAATPRRQGKREGAPTAP